jgi:hypothetical protein
VGGNLLDKISGSQTCSPVLADPVAALVIAALIAWEAREAWEGMQDCC